MDTAPIVTVLAGGVGAGRLLRGLTQLLPPHRIAVVANVADDERIYGLHVSPDIDTVLYALSGSFDDERGFGIRGDTFRWLEALERLGTPGWFRIGDQDLATHVRRTLRLSEGAPLSQITSELARALGVRTRMLPATDDRVRTVVATDEGELAFQDYFVRRACRPAVRAVRFVGADAARPGPGVLEAIAEAEAIIIAPSNPIISIGPILAVPGIGEAIARRRERSAAVSPIVGGRAIKGPAAAMMAALGMRVDAAGVARLYRHIAAALVVDTADGALAGDIEREGVRAVVAPSVMIDQAARRALAETTLRAAGVAWAS